MTLSENIRRRRAISLAAGTILVLLAAHAASRFGSEPDIAENRVLAEWPTTPGDPAAWATYPKAVDAYVQDRFPARTRLIAGLNTLRYRIGDSGSSRVVVGRDGWLFYDDGSHLGIARGSMPLNKAETQRWLRTLAARAQTLAHDNVPYLVLVPPLKERVYPEYAPRWFVDGGEAVDSQRLGSAAKAAGYSNVVYLLPRMLEAKRSEPWLYSRYDTHWSGFGAYQGYVALAEALAGTRAAIPTWPLARYRALPVEAHAGPRDLALMLGIAGNVEQHYPQFDIPASMPPPKTTYLGERQDWTGPRIIETGHAGPTLLLTVDSFSNAMLPFLYPHVSRLIVSHNQDGYYRDDLIQRYKPDAVVTEVLESGIRHAMAPAMDPAVEPVGGTIRGDLSIRKAGPDVPPPGGVCNLEIVALGRDQSGRANLKLEGWTFDAERNQAAGATRIVIDLGRNAGRYETTLPNNVGRQDVAAHFGKSAGANAGFSALLPLETDVALEKALHEAQVAGQPVRFLLVQGAGAGGYACVSERGIVVAR